MVRVRDREVLAQLEAAGARQVPFRMFVNVTTTGSTAEWAGAGKPVKVSALAFDREALPETKVAVISVISQELARIADPLIVDTVGNDLVVAVSDRVSEHLLSHEAAITDVQPAGLLNGLTSVGGGSPNTIEADVTGDLIGAVRGANRASRDSSRADRRCACLLGYAWTTVSGCSPTSI